MTAAPRVPPDVHGWTTGLARATSVELGKAVGARAGRLLLIASVVLGLAVALAMAFTVPAEDRTFALTSFHVQSAQRWAHVGVVVLVWVVTLNVAGMLRLHRLIGASAMSAHVG
jgi:hypothetical protein